MRSCRKERSRARLSATARRPARLVTRHRQPEVEPEAVARLPHVGRRPLLVAGCDWSQAGRTTPVAPTTTRSRPRRPRPALRPHARAVPVPDNAGRSRSWPDPRRSREPRRLGGGAPSATVHVPSRPSAGSRARRSRQVAASSASSVGAVRTRRGQRQWRHRSDVAASAPAPPVSATTAGRRRPWPLDRLDDGVRQVRPTVLGRSERHRHVPGDHIRGRSLGARRSLGDRARPSNGRSTTTEPSRESCEAIGRPTRAHVDPGTTGGRSGRSVQPHAVSPGADADQLPGQSSGHDARRWRTALRRGSAIAQTRSPRPSDPRDVIDTSSGAPVDALGAAVPGREPAQLRGWRIRVHRPVPGRRPPDRANGVFDAATGAPLWTRARLRASSPSRPGRLTDQPADLALLLGDPGRRAPNARSTLEVLAPRRQLVRLPDRGRSGPSMSCRPTTTAVPRRSRWYDVEHRLDPCPRLHRRARSCSADRRRTGRLVPAGRPGRVHVYRLR